MKATGKPRSGVLLTVEQVAELMGVSHMTVRRLIELGELPYTNVAPVGRQKLRIPEAGYLAWVESRTRRVKAS